MDIVYWIAERLIRKQKHTYSREQGMDYGLQRANAQKQIRKIPRNVRWIPDEHGEFLLCEKNPKDKIIFYIHGGGFCFGSAASSRRFTLHMARHFGYDVFAADYALAPERPYPEGLQDCVAAYQMIEAKYGGRNIAIVGDSAGGNLVVATLLELIKKGLPLPASFLLLSPTLQYVEKTESYQKNNATDCMVDGETFIDEIRDVYLRMTDVEKLKNPDYSPLYGDFSSFPKGCVIVSDSESLYDDSTAFKARMDSFGRDCDLQVYHHLMHVFPTIPEFRASKPVLKKMKTFIEHNFQEANS